MQEFTSELAREPISGFLAGFMPAWEFRGALAEEALKLVFLPLHEFSLASCVVSLGWIAIFWKNKGLLVSGLSHMLHIADWFSECIKKVLPWLKA